MKARFTMEHLTPFDLTELLEASGNAGSCILTAEYIGTAENDGYLAVYRCTEADDRAQPWHPDAFITFKIYLECNRNGTIKASVAGL